MYLGHYTSLKSLELILEKVEMKFGTLNKTNDPFENKNLIFSRFTMSRNTIQLGNTRKLYSKEFINKYFNLICFTVSDELVNIYSKPRMWAQYANNHDGCCIVLRKDIFDVAFNTHGGYKYKKAQKIDYNLEEKKKQIKNAIGIMGFQSQDDDIKMGIKKIREYIWEKSHDVFLFSKMKDWAEENEFRYCIYSEHDVKNINIKNSIEEIILGEKVTKSMTSMLNHYCSNLGITVSKIYWDNGFPEKIVISNQ